MQLIERVWRTLPEGAKAKVRGVLAAQRIGRLPEPDPRLRDFDTIFDVPTEMSFEERLFLYALVRGTRPSRILEIGTSQGGSAAIFAAALEANGAPGIVVGIDPMPRIELPDEAFHARFHLVTGESPGAIAQAVEAAGGPFDLVLVDGMHIYQQAAADVGGALPFMAPDGYLLFHDSFHFGVSEAIREALEADPTLIDCGYVCNQPRRVGDLLTHAGFRLVRRGPEVVDVLALVKPVWDEVQLPPPHDPDLRNHDIYWCEYVEPCDWCAKRGLGITTTTA
jgi:predicted O-methyltransferase YrrM